MVLALFSTLVVLLIVFVSPDIVSGNLDAISASSKLLQKEPLSFDDKQGLPEPLSFNGAWLQQQAGGGFDSLAWDDQHNIFYVQLPTAPQTPANLNAHASNDNNNDDNNDDNNNNKTPNATHAPKTPTQQLASNAANSRQSGELLIQTLVSNSSALASIDYQSFQVSPSRKFVLVSSAREKRFRHSSTALFFVYDIANDVTIPLSVLLAANSSSFVEHRLQIASWFFNKRLSSDALLLAAGNELFVVPSVDEFVARAGELSTVDQLTFDASLNVESGVQNGVANWLYEEEVLSDSRAFEVAPSGDKLAFLHFDDSKVQQVPITFYAPSKARAFGRQTQAVSSADYTNWLNVPRVAKLRYPKTGRANSRVTANIIEIQNKASSPASRQSMTLQLPEQLAREQHYLTSLVWLTSSQLALAWSNRRQNDSRLLICSQSSNWQCKQSLRFATDEGWVDFLTNPRIKPLNESHFLLLTRKFEGAEVGYFNHIALVSIDESVSKDSNDDTGGNKGLVYLTSGKFQVTDINAADQKAGVVYFTSTLYDEPGQRHLQAASLSQLGYFECVTCELLPDECKYNSALISPSSQYFVFECMGPGVPRFELRRLVVAQADSPQSVELHYSNKRMFSSRLIWLIYDNAAFKKQLNERIAMPIQLRLEFPIRNSTHKARVLLLLPPPVAPHAGNGETASRLRSASLAFQVHQRQQQKLLSLSHSNTKGDNQSSEGGDLLTQEFHLHLNNNSIGDYTSKLMTNEAKFPMLVEVYAGPESQRVDFRFSLSFGVKMASSKRVVYAYIDGRGSGCEGSKRAFELYNGLGSVEIDDQINVGQQITQLLGSFVDKRRVGIWGWSYGGYASAMALARSNSQAAQQFVRQQQVEAGSAQTEVDGKDPGFGQLATIWSAANTLIARRRTLPPLINANTFVYSEPQVDASRQMSLDNESFEPRSVFECAASVAPVTDWLLYDSTYSERYMASPFKNEKFDYSEFDDHLQEQQTNPLSTKTSIPGNYNDVNDRYKKASLLENIAKIDKKRYLLVHGTGDDNVHFQQSLLLMKKLTSEHVLYESQLYTDEDHSLGGRKNRMHWSLTLASFFSECFDLDSASI